MNKIFLDTETIGLREAFPDGDDILYQLSYVVEAKDGNTDVCDGLGKPERYQEMAVEAMEKTGITPDDLTSMNPIQNTLSWKHLDKISKEEKYVIFAHNSPFDMNIIERSGIDISKFQVIDTLKIARVINDNLGLPWDSCRLGYLYYKLELYKNKPELLYRLDIDLDGLSSHNSLYDVIDLMLLWEYFVKEYSVKIDDAIYLTSQKLVLKYMPSGKHKGKLISELDYNTLKWNAENSYDENVKHTCSTLLGKR